MNYLKDKKCYLSAPIEFSEGRNWRPEIVQKLTDAFELNVFDPFDDPKQQWVPDLNKAREEADYDTIERVAKTFVRKDLGSVDESKFLIAYLPYKVPTTGTVHEILNAYNQQKPVLLVSDHKRNIPFWYWGIISHRYFFNGWNELYNYLAEVGAGYHKNDDRWHLVYGTI